MKRECTTAMDLVATGGYPAVAAALKAAGFVLVSEEPVQPAAPYRVGAVPGNKVLWEQWDAGDADAPRVATDPPRRKVTDRRPLSEIQADLRDEADKRARGDHRKRRQSLTLENGDDDQPLQGAEENLGEVDRAGAQAVQRVASIDVVSELVFPPECREAADCALEHRSVERGVDGRGHDVDRDKGARLPHRVMTAAVVNIRDFERRAGRPPPDCDAVVIVLPVVAIERHGEDDGAVPVRRGRQSLLGQP
jgi:hypothetical protein